MALFLVVMLGVFGGCEQFIATVGKCFNSSCHLAYKSQAEFCTSNRPSRGTTSQSTVNNSSRPSPTSSLPYYLTFRVDQRSLVQLLLLLHHLLHVTFLLLVLLVPNGFLLLILHVIYLILLVYLSEFLFQVFHKM